MACKTSQDRPSVDTFLQSAKIIIYVILKHIPVLWLFKYRVGGSIIVFLALFHVFCLNFLHSFPTALPPYSSTSLSPGLALFSLSFFFPHKQDSLKTTACLILTVNSVIFVTSNHCFSSLYVPLSPSANVQQFRNTNDKFLSQTKAFPDTMYNSWEFALTSSCNLLFPRWCAPQVQAPSPQIPICVRCQCPALAGCCGGVSVRGRGCPVPDTANSSCPQAQGCSLWLVWKHLLPVLLLADEFQLLVHKNPSSSACPRSSATFRCDSLG